MAKPRTTIFQKKEHNRAQVLLLFSEKLWIRGIFYNGNIPINGAKGQGLRGCFWWIIQHKNGLEQGNSKNLDLSYGMDWFFL